jgi:ubiquinone/menaquinone biosynthesis C-methylase UbiE
MIKVLLGNDMDRMPNWAFRIMAFMFNITDLFQSTKKKLDPFNIQKGETVVDYGSGTGRYLPVASELVGEQGLVYAVDIQELAVKSAFKRIRKYKLKNVVPILTDGRTVSIQSHSVDIIYALDMFHMVKDPNVFLTELNRLMKPDGILYLEDGHQPRPSTKEKILNSNCWDLTDETKTFVVCKPKTSQSVIQ